MSTGSGGSAVCLQAFAPSPPVECRRAPFALITIDCFIRRATANYFAITVIEASVAEEATSHRCADQSHFSLKIAFVLLLASHRCLVCQGETCPGPPGPGLVQAAAEIFTNL